MPILRPIEMLPVTGPWESQEPIQGFAPQEIIQPEPIVEAKPVETDPFRALMGEVLPAPAPIGGAVQKLVKPPVEKSVRPVLSPPISKLEKQLFSENAKAREIFDARGLSMPECADQLSMIMHTAQDAQLRLKVCDLALKVHGALEPEKISSDIIIQFTFNGEPAVGVLIPR